MASSAQSKVGKCSSRSIDGFELRKRIGADWMKPTQGSGSCCNAGSARAEEGRCDVTIARHGWSAAPDKQESKWAQRAIRSSAVSWLRNGIGEVLRSHPVNTMSELPAGRVGFPRDARRMRARGAAERRPRHLATGRSIGARKRRSCLASIELYDAHTACSGIRRSRLRSGTREGVL